MATRHRIGVVGTMANVPFAGMAWMHGQFLAGLARLGHEVFYVETTSNWPYDPKSLTTTDDPRGAVEYLGKVMSRFGLGDQWAYRAAYADGRWFGPLGTRAVEMLRSADAVLNISGSTTPKEIGVPCRLVYIGTDPVLQEIRIANGDALLRKRVEAHDAHFTYGENIGSPFCPVPPLPAPARPMRQPIVLDFWDGPAPSRNEFTTVMNWSVQGYDVAYRGDVFNWSKEGEFLKFIDLPRRANVPLELALGLSGLSPDVKRLLESNGWKVVDAYEMSQDPWRYRDYVRDSRAEFSVAKDMVVRTRCGWFSERSACYLAAGRPVVTQDTGFAEVLPTGDGLFSFNKIEEALSAFDAIQSDYPRHSRAARAIAHDYFRAETVLANMLGELGLAP